MELDEHGRPVKAEWGDGPWQDEPDRVEWRHAGLPCLARRGPGGHWCGYVAVSPDHPFHGQAFRLPPVDVHDGLSYGAPCDGREGEGICHVPRPGEPADVWWFGFACGSSYDYRPCSAANDRLVATLAGVSFVPVDADEVYRDLTYVTAETNNLAEQLAALAQSAAASAGDQITP